MSNITKEALQIKRSQREAQKNQRACVLWFTGLSASGKSTLAQATDQQLTQAGYHCYLLDGDNLRSGLNSDLSFSDDDRSENIRRVSEVSQLFVDAGIIVLAAFISPFIEDREKLRARIGADKFIEIFVDAPLNICEQRDPKGLYQRARAGEITNFTGIDSPYQKPENPQIHIQNTSNDITAALNAIMKYLHENRFVKLPS